MDNCATFQTLNRDHFTTNSALERRQCLSPDILGQNFCALLLERNALQGKHHYPAPSLTTVAANESLGLRSRAGERSTETRARGYGFCFLGEARGTLVAEDRFATCKGLGKTGRCLNFLSDIYSRSCRLGKASRHSMSASRLCIRGTSLKRFAPFVSDCGRLRRMNFSKSLVKSNLVAGEPTCHSVLSDRESKRRA